MPSALMERMNTNVLVSIKQPAPYFLFQVFPVFKNECGKAEYYAGDKCVKRPIEYKNTHAVQA